MNKKPLGERVESSGNVFLGNLYIFLSAFKTSGVACRNEIYLKTKLSTATIDKCISMSIKGGMLKNAGGDNRKQDLQLTSDGYRLQALTGRMV